MLSPPAGVDHNVPFSHIAANVRICQKPPYNDGFSSARGMADIRDFPARRLSGLERAKAADACCHNRSVLTPKTSQPVAPRSAFQAQRCGMAN